MDTLKENNEEALPMFTESSGRVGTGKYSRLCALFPACGHFCPSGQAGNSF